MVSNSIFHRWKQFNTSTVSEHNYLLRYFRIQERPGLNYNNMCRVAALVPNHWLLKEAPLLQENICFPNTGMTFCSILGFTKHPAKQCCLCQITVLHSQHAVTPGTDEESSENQNVTAAEEPFTEHTSLEGICKQVRQKLGVQRSYG